MGHLLILYYVLIQTFETPTNAKNVLITSTTREVDELRAEIAMLNEENDIKINLLVKVQYKELEELRNENTSLINHVNVNFRQYEVDPKLKESELKKLLRRSECWKMKRLNH